MLSVYSNISQDIQKSLMYQGFEEEVVELLQLEDPKLLVRVCCPLI